MSVVAKHIGRLGNNMFQIAAAIGYARKYGYQWGVDPNPGVGEPYSSIHKSFPNLPKECQIGGIRFHEHNNEFCPLHNMHKDDCHFDYHPIPDMGPNVLLTGFYQSWRYFEHCKDEVKKVFELPEIYGYEDYVSIHVRRGDYVQHAGSFPPINEKYLFDAMGLIFFKTRINKFIIFSDDMKWCMDFVSNGVVAQEKEDNKELIEYKDFIFEFSEGKSELEDLSFMASCGHHIIANSSFSWWGAYLGHNPNRIVVSPSKETWFGPDNGVKKPVVDLIPDNWIQIHTR